MSRTWLLVGAALSAVLGTVAACEKSPAGPTPPPGNSPGTPTATATRVEITGPASIAPGVPTQFTATVHLSDGSSRDVTVSSVWRSAWFQFVVSAPGLVTARVNGVADLSAAYQGLTSTREVIAVPEGTFRLTGIVTDVTAPAGPVNGAQVQVTDGSARGLSTFTGPDGRYSLLGVAGGIELRVTKSGYKPHVQRVVVTDHQAVNVELPIDGRLPDVSGSYVLTIDAADTCASVLPEEAISRKYSAIVRQVGPEIRIEVGGARFATFVPFWTANVIRSGRVWPDNVEFGLGGVGCNLHYYGLCPGPDVMEELAPSRFYLPSGFVALSISPTVLSGRLEGEIGIYSRSAVNVPFRHEVSCRSSRHGFTLSR